MVNTKFIRPFLAAVPYSYNRFEKVSGKERFLSILLKYLLLATKVYGALYAGTLKETVYWGPVFIPTIQGSCP